MYLGGGMSLPGPNMPPSEGAKPGLNVGALGDSPDWAK